MSALTVRNLDDEVKRRLRIRAAENGRSMEAEVRAILQDVLIARNSEVGLGSRIAAHFAEFGGVELDIPPRTDMPREIDLGE